MEKVAVSLTPEYHMYSPMPLQCPGCGAGIVNRLLCEVLEEMGIGMDAIGVFGVGCHSFGMVTMNTDCLSTAHGRALDAATGIKRCLGRKPIVYVVMGDGDCISIGAEGFFHAAGRGEKVTAIMVNNSNYGTTGGQMAPTTIPGQVTATTPQGRNPEHGYTVHAVEALLPWKGVAYSARGAVNSPANYQHTKRYLKTAFQKQIDEIGFSFVEILSACPADWHMTPIQALKWMEEKMLTEFPLGEFKNVDRIE